jgi:hypothetical protein
MKTFWIGGLGEKGQLVGHPVFYISYLRTFFHGDLLKMCTRHFNEFFVEQ